MKKGTLLRLCPEEFNDQYHYDRWRVHGELYVLHRISRNGLLEVKSLATGALLTVLDHRMKEADDAEGDAAADAQAGQ